MRRLYKREVVLQCLCMSFYFGGWGGIQQLWNPTGTKPQRSSNSKNLIKCEWIRTYHIFVPQSVMPEALSSQVQFLNCHKPELSTDIVEKVGGRQQHIWLSTQYHVQGPRFEPLLPTFQGEASFINDESSTIGVSVSLLSSSLCSIQERETKEVGGR